MLDLRRRWSVAKRGVRKAANAVPGINIPGPSSRSIDEDNPSRAWRGADSPIENDDYGILALSEEEDELEEGPGLTRCAVSLSPVGFGADAHSLSRYR